MGRHTNFVNRRGVPSPQTGVSASFGGKCSQCFGMGSPNPSAAVPWGRMTSSHNIELAESTQTLARGREVQLLLNIAEPDPEYQPGVLTDAASLLDAVPTERKEIARRLDAYFRADLELDLELPIWQVVDAIKRIRPGWPDVVEPN